MKVSFAISMQATSFEAVAQGNWKDNLALMQNLGFEGVELAIRDPEFINMLDLGLVLERYGLELAAIGTGQAYVDEGLSLSHKDSVIRSKATSRLKKHIELAATLGGQVIIGLIRGNLGKNPAERVIKLKHLMNSMTEVADYAYEKGVFLTIEPLNRYEIDNLNRCEEVTDFIKGIGCPNLGILLDTFHMNIEERVICETIRSSNGILSHVHLADSNRQCPGNGHLDFLKVIDTLRYINYNGFISGEILPYSSIEITMRNYINFLRGMENVKF